MFTIDADGLLVTRLTDRLVGLQDIDDRLNRLVMSQVQIKYISSPLHTIPDTGGYVISSTAL